MRLVFVLAALWLFASSASAQVRLTGNVPDEVSDENVQKVWEFVQTLTGIKSKEAPMVRFAVFTCESGNPAGPEQVADWDAEHPVRYAVCTPGSDDAAWNERAAAWHRNHPEAPNPLPRSSMGWFFEDTDVLQVSPVAFTRFPGTGQGYAILAHELEHYLYDGVLPVESQHCYFENQGHRTATIDFLVTSGIGSDALRVPRVDMVPQSGCDEVKP